MASAKKHTSASKRAKPEPVASIVTTAPVPLASVFAMVAAKRAAAKAKTDKFFHSSDSIRKRHATYAMRAARLLWEGFTWGESKEGDKYWLEITQRLEQIAWALDESSAKNAQRRVKP